MKAKDLSGQAPGGKRTPLAQVLPLSTPFVVQIFPVYACNFKCSYCIFSIEESARGFISDKVVMDFDLFCKCIDEMKTFPEKIKVLRFVGIGEPLLHKKISDMVKYAVESEVANTVEVLTNASLLNHEMSDSLIDAGLNRLVVSLQGTSARKYSEVCDTDIDYDQFISNLSYFFEKKINTQLYVKVIDCALDGEEDEKKFYHLFGDICDSLAIEHAVPIHKGINYDDVLDPESLEVTQFGLPVTEVAICPQPFFTMQINPDGKVVPCFSFEYPGIMGDCRQESVTDIWNGTCFQKFRRTMLEGTKGVSESCHDCSIIKYRLFPEDELNEDAERLKEFYEK